MGDDSSMKQVVPWFEMSFKNLVGKGVTLEPGKAYLITFEERFTGFDVNDLQEYLTNIETQYGCKFLILHGLGKNVPTVYEISAILSGNYSALLEQEDVQVLAVSRKFRPEKKE